MVTRVSVDELSKTLREVINRARDLGESFIIVEDGNIVAELSPPEPTEATATFKDLVRILLEEDLIPVDDDRAADLERIHASQPVLGGPPKWED